ncbi:unnamed protein product [Durusdinium trenchii]|uniref:Uncharacterized protein n=1 Tax=Durusdinium trenchii TaxID=1381693 RepID=A0ABP0KQH6_9DINO
MHISKEAALRNGNLIGLDLFGTERKIRDYAKTRNAHVIGDGIVAFPPCSPQPYCMILEVLGNKIAGTGKMCVPPEVAALLPEAQQHRQRRRFGRGAESAFLGTAGDWRPGAGVKSEPAPISKEDLSLQSFSGSEKVCNMIVCFQGTGRHKQEATRGSWPYY